MNLPENLSFDEKVKIFNEESDKLYKWLGINHPALNIQLVKVDHVQGNDYNPNKVAPPEMKLLELSIKKDGLTMPVVVCDTPEASKPYTVVDGFHRTTVARKNKEIRGEIKDVKFRRSFFIDLYIIMVTWLPTIYIYCDFLLLS